MNQDSQLRAAVRVSMLANQLQQGRMMSSPMSQISPIPTSSEHKSPHVLAEHGSNGCVTVTLNRPKALNALNVDMIKHLRQIYTQIYNDKRSKKGLYADTKVILLKGEGKAYCAGGDIRALMEAALKKDLHFPIDFFTNEYGLDYQAWHFNAAEVPAHEAAPDTVVVAILHGVSMGGGMGLSMGSHYKVVTDTTMFAMPETGIGLFPDVGGSYFLARGKMAGPLGLYLGLTGARLKAADCLYSGVATHYAPSNVLGELAEAIKNADYTKTSVKEIIDKYCTTTAPESSHLASHRETIERCFSANSLEDIYQRLEQENTEWAKKTLETLKQKSPTSLKISLRAIKAGAKMSLKEVFEMEYVIALNCMMGQDFPEGVRAVIVDKDNKAKWNPPHVNEVTEEMVKKHFTPLENVPQLKL